MRTNPKDPCDRLAAVERRLAGERAHLADLEADLAARRTAQRAKIREDAGDGLDYPVGERIADTDAIRVIDRNVQRQRNAVEVLAELHEELAGEVQRCADNGTRQPIGGP